MKLCKDPDFKLGILVLFTTQILVLHSADPTTTENSRSSATKRIIFTTEQPTRMFHLNDTSNLECPSETGTMKIGEKKYLENCIQLECITIKGQAVLAEVRCPTTTQELPTGCQNVAKSDRNFPHCCLSTMVCNMENKKEGPRNGHYVAPGRTHGKRKNSLTTELSQSASNSVNVLATHNPRKDDGTPRGTLTFIDQLRYKKIKAPQNANENRDFSFKEFLARSRKNKNNDVKPSFFLPLRTTKKVQKSSDQATEASNHPDLTDSMFKKSVNDTMVENTTLAPTLSVEEKRNLRYQRNKAMKRVSTRRRLSAILSSRRLRSDKTNKTMIPIVAATSKKQKAFLLQPKNHSISNSVRLNLNKPARRVIKKVKILKMSNKTVNNTVQRNDKRKQRQPVKPKIEKKLPIPSNKVPAVSVVPKTLNFGIPKKQIVPPPLPSVMKSTVKDIKRLPIQNRRQLYSRRLNRFRKKNLTAKPAQILPIVQEQKTYQSVAALQTKTSVSASTSKPQISQITTELSRRRGKKPHTKPQFTLNTEAPLLKPAVLQLNKRIPMRTRNELLKRRKNQLAKHKRKSLLPSYGNIKDDRLLDMLSYESKRKNTNLNSTEQNEKQSSVIQEKQKEIAKAMELTETKRKLSENTKIVSNVATPVSIKGNPTTNKSILTDRGKSKFYLQINSPRKNALRKMQSEVANATKVKKSNASIKTTEINKKTAKVKEETKPVVKETKEIKNKIPIINKDLKKSKPKDGTNSKSESKKVSKTVNIPVFNLNAGKETTISPIPVRGKKVFDLSKIPRRKKVRVASESTKSKVISPKKNKVKKEKASVGKIPKEDLGNEELNTIDDEEYIFVPPPNYDPENDPDYPKIDPVSPDLLADFEENFPEESETKEFFEVDLSAPSAADLEKLYGDGDNEISDVEVPVKVTTILISSSKKSYRSSVDRNTSKNFKQVPLYETKTFYKMLKDPPHKLKAPKPQIVRVGDQIIS